VTLRVASVNLTAEHREFDLDSTNAGHGITGTSCRHGFPEASIAGWHLTNSLLRFQVEQHKLQLRSRKVEYGLQFDWRSTLIDLKEVQDRFFGLLRWVYGYKRVLLFTPSYREDSTTWNLD
jgi:hypothetical protein